MDGSSGAKATEDSWPAFHKSTVHASPLTYDFDFDNIQDIPIASYDGEILAYKDTVSGAGSSSHASTDGRTGMDTYMSTTTRMSLVELANTLFLLVSVLIFQ